MGETGASTHATARKTMAIVSSPMKALLNRRKQSAARTIAGVMMMKLAVLRLQKKKWVKVGRLFRGSVKVFRSATTRAATMPTLTSTVDLLKKMS